MIRIQQHKSASYAPRTYANAHDGDVTAAFAVDYFTAGEKLTKKAAGERFIALPLQVENIEVPAAENAEKLIAFMKEKNARSINIAGNGIYTMTRFNWDQDRINQYLYDVLKIVHQEMDIQKVISGGQTGADIGGTIAASCLNINTVTHMPKGFIQRHAEGKDESFTPNQIFEQIKSGMAKVFSADQEKIQSKNHNKL